ncbi:MAG: DNA polymerase III subunit beta [Candidatus Zambryskibacteria bacterium RIFCSPHIGHO2_02_FULL_39_16]|uniref:Beta sliding clamp n=1 Tax=Candidatus Zambryskibacteria bacterium RIFCSPLOWO2_02_FULL_39_14 TaxID=1802769 RepID=A0A1G2UH76_9BACT|nr:MAG: polymerase III subunit beta protein [Parcubacteria group bacterium GW2011_GWC1_39_8]OHA95172.1 MAG: DNA polymerase III subunit beta [Candidatus Zambryskibacteria bacterium RIFCSPHIGHO2_02_FULL_39_16]OHB08781.1 MAG: DNA polymerase III subunit beta [Candidatus Zambryskibacteria bacterium RIFCSPLOWO2_02_FULL_39_14]
MKIECIKDQLEEALNKADKIAGKNTTLPVLSGFYLNAHQNILSIKATNLDLGISINLPVKVVEPGIIVVPAHTISSFISSLSKDKNIVINTKEQVLEIKTSTTKTSIKTFSGEDFPLIPEISDDKAFSLPTRDLVFGIRSVIYSAATSSVKPELSSISVTYDGEFLIFAATDSFRLAEKKIRVKKIPHFKQILIPQKNAMEIVKIFDKGEEETSISIEEHQMALRSQNIYLTSRIIEGTFPDYKQIIPKKITSKAVLLKQDLINSLKTSLIFSDAFNQLTLHLSPKNKKFEIESKNSTVGESIHTVDSVLEGDDISINVNHRYFTDCFQSITTDSISLTFSGQAKPIVIQGVGDSSFLYLVMPMNQS